MNVDKSERAKNLILRISQERFSYLNEVALLYLTLYYHLNYIPLGSLKSIVEDWDKYYCRSDIRLDQYCNKYNDYFGRLRKDVTNFSNLNMALSIPIYSDSSVRKRFYSPLIDHDLFTMHDFEWDFKGEIESNRHFSRFSPLIDFYVNEHNSSKVEISFIVTSLALNHGIDPLKNAIRTIIYAWGKYYQRSDLANNSNVPLKSENIHAFRNMNIAFGIPIHTKGRVRKEFYSEMVYKTLASLHKQGITINNDVHRFIGKKYGFSQGTSKNYYSYLLAKGAPSVSGRLKITNKRSGLEIPFSVNNKDLTDFQKFMNGKI